MKTLCELFYEISITSSSKAKKTLLLNFEDQVKLKEVLKLVYDPDQLFKITSSVIKEKISCSQSGDRNDIHVDDLADLIKVSGTNNKIEYLKAKKQFMAPSVWGWLLKCIDKDLGIGIKKKHINDAFPGLIKDFPVMLAAKRDKEAFLRTFEDTIWVYLNLKIDGIRCIADNTGDTPMFYTREGHQISDFFVENIKPEIAKLPKKIFDGEIYCDDFQTLMTVFRRQTYDQTSIRIRNTCKYCIFDIVDFETKLIDRVDFLDRNVPESRYTKKMRYVIVPTNYDKICEVAKKYIERGDEGIIVKHPESLYMKKRSNVWMKFKNKETEDCKILNYYEGEGKYTGLLGGFVVSFNGKELGVGGGYSDSERMEFWKNRDDYIGKTMEISFMEKTKDDLARHPVFERMRIDK